MCHASAVADGRSAPYCACRSCGGLYLASYPAEQPNAVFAGTDGAARQQALDESRRAYFVRHLLSVEQRMGSVVQDWRLMEIGCGAGVLLQAATERGWRADALEFSPELADIARRANPASAIETADIMTYTHGAGDYDAVLALDVLEHVLDPSLMLKNCCAMLKPGGLLLLQTPNTHSLRCRLQGDAWEMRDPAQHLNLCSPRSVRGLLVSTGFQVVALHTVSGTGQEQGLGQVAAAVKQWLLDRAKLGNALCVMARRV